MLRVRLLGGLDVDGVDSRALGSRKARTLVKVLALARGNPVATDTLVEALWPYDERPARPNEQVGVLVSRLRGVLGADSIARSDAGWSLALGWLDIIELESRVDEAAGRLAAGSAGAARAAVRAALALVRGELLPDELDAVWAEADRAAVARVIARARLLNAEAALAAGDAAEAAATAEGALDHDPYDEIALRMLMRAHGAAGRPASALAAYARLRERLRDDLGVEPAPETEELHTAILLGNAVAAPVTARPSARVVGRDRELRWLDEQLAAVAGGAAKVCVIAGEPGIGKTTLVGAWTASHEDDAFVISGRCDALGRDLPLQPVLDGLDAHLRTLDAAAASGLLADTESLLGPLLGRFDQTAAASSPASVADPEAGRALLFAALLRTLTRAADRGPLVLVVEDVHLAGTSTIEFLGFAARRASNALVVMTTRASGAVFRDAEVLELGPLDLPAVIALVGEERADDLFARSGGHPLFLTELAEASGDALPTSVREAAASRVDGLGDAAATLHAAAILGVEIDVDLLTGVVGMPVSTLLEHLEAGMRAAVVEEGDGRLRFRHELVREALIASTTAARRALVHREAAAVLTRRPSVDPLEVAYHARAGGDAPLAARALVDAAETAVRRFDNTTAEELLDDALSLDDTAAAHLARGRLRMARWDVDGARADAAAAQQAGGGVAAVELAAWVEYYGRDYDRAYRFAEEAIERADDDALRASCLAMTGRVEHARGDLAAADERLSRAEKLAPQSSRGYPRLWLASLRMHQGHLDDAVDLADRAELDGAWQDHPFVRHHGFFARTVALGHQGRFEQARSALTVAKRHAVEAGLDGARFTVALDNVHSWLLRRVGRMDEADEITETVIETSAGGPQTSEMHAAALLDALDGQVVRRDADGIARAAGRAAAVDDFRGTMAWHQRQRLAFLRAQVALQHSDLDRAEELSQWVVDDAAARGAQRYGALAAALVLVARAHRDDEIEADRAFATFDALEACAAPEAWGLTAQMAAATGAAQWWRDADRRAGALVAAAGDDAESLRRHIAATFAALGRR